MSTNKEMAALAFLIGHWQTQGSVTGENGDTEKFSGTDSYEWVLDGRFILHKVDVMMQGEKVEALELIGDFDAATRRYRMRSFDNQGAYTQMEAWLDEERTLYILGDRMRAQLYARDTHTLTAQWQRSEDNKSWKPWMELTLRR